MYDPSCFVQPANGSYGNAGVGILQGLGVWSYDAGLYKRFNFSSNERWPRLRLAANALNALNHAGWTSGGTYTASAYTVNGPAAVVAKSTGGFSTNGTTQNRGNWRMIFIEARLEW